MNISYKVRIYGCNLTHQLIIDLKLGKLRASIYVPILACSLMFLKVHKKGGKDVSRGLIRQSTSRRDGREQE